MREKFTLAFDHSTLEQLIANELTITGFLETLFGDKGSPNYRDICGSLVAYHNKDGGSPEVIEFEMADAVFKQETLSGHFKCKFGIHFFYTCSGIHNDAKDNIRWDFQLDKDQHMISFLGEEPWVRDAE